MAYDLQSRSTLFTILSMPFYIDQDYALRRPKPVDAFTILSMPFKLTGHTTQSFYNIYYAKSLHTAPFSLTLSYHLYLMCIRLLLYH